LRKLNSVFLLVLLTINFSCAQNDRPKNIIILIGDGMGINSVGANLLTDANSPFNEFKSIGLSITCSADKLITDSAAGATAIATGYLTKNKFVSVDTLGNPLYTIFEQANSLGISTGIVVTSTVSHATPGGFFAHTNDRNDELLIASQLVDKNVNVIIGGGQKYFLPQNLVGERKDNRNLIQEFEDKKYQFADDFDKLKEIPNSINHLISLMAMDGLPKASVRNYSLGDLTLCAINHLKSNKNGFVLMIEGSQIDWAAHDHKSIELLEETQDFSTAVKVALEFAKMDRNTLVLVTSDHETGGMSIINGNRDAKALELSFTTLGHTPSPVGIFAFGPGEEKFRGILHINEIGQNLFHLINPHSISNH